MSNNEYDTVSFITGKSINQTYEKKSLHDKILHAPDSYVGSVEETTEKMWIYNGETSRMELRETTFVEGFFKIFDEVLVNAIDQIRRLEDAQRENPNVKYNHVKTIRVEINRETGWISVENDGDGIEIVKHPEHKIYVPQLIFSELLTSTNYDNDVKRTVGGKNGYGAKLANIFSQVFHLETVDHHRKLKFSQECRNNMFEVGAPVIEKYTKKPYTRVSFLPDFEKFGIDKEVAQDWDLLERRVYDSCACTGKDVSVYLNGEKVNTKTFEQYVELYLGPKKECPRVYYKPNERWEVCFCLSDAGEGRQVSFVNGIFTDQGGTHVNHVLDNVCKRVADEINGKSKQLNVKPEHVKRNLWVFVKSIIENPSFNGQTKRQLTSTSTKKDAKTGKTGDNWGSRCFTTKPSKVEKETNEELVKNLIKKLGIATRAKRLSDFVNANKLEKVKGSHTGTVNIPKLVDAHFAGKSKSLECTLVLTEGDSAKSSACEGIGTLDDFNKKRYGLFPLKGKLLNVREATAKQLAENAEIINIIKILGLRYGVNYGDDENFKKLRYGRIMILTDADHDGEHIKGLIMNFFHYNWPSLMEREGFICGMVTPIVKARQYQGKKVLDVLNFYSEREYLKWVVENPQLAKKYEPKYYKGLGTSTPKEAKEWFREMKVVYYKYDNDENVPEIDHAVSRNKSDLAIELAFKAGKGKDMTNKRKEWLREFNQKLKDCDDISEIPPFRECETYHQFINDRLINFSNYDVVRSIPSLCDGFKPCMRKVMYTALQRNLKREIKVSQFAGSVSEISAYHHGEASLNGTIIGMAKNYPGSNNVNLLVPAGQFGSRRQKDDAASPRYISTCLEEITHLLFDSRDMPILDHQKDDGKPIEPKFYMPVIPTILVNGAHGIGTGFSTTVPMYNPIDIMNNIELMLSGSPPEKMIPWYRGFKGTVEPCQGKSGYTVSGIWEYGKDTNEIIITEIPLGYSKCKTLEDYVIFLENLKGENAGKRKKNKTDSETESISSRSTVRAKNALITKKIKQEGLVQSIEKDITDQYNFRIKVTLNPEIAEEIEETELEKKLGLCAHISTDNMNLFDHNGEIKLYNNELEILDDFYQIRLEHYGKRREYQLAYLKYKLNVAQNKSHFIEDNADEIKIYRKSKWEKHQILTEGGYDQIAPWQSKSEPSYNYLLSIKIDDFSQDKVDELEREIQKIKTEIEELDNMTLEDLWYNDLEKVRTEYEKHMEEWQDSVMDDADNYNKSKTKKRGKSKK